MIYVNCSTQRRYNYIAQRCIYLFLLSSDNLVSVFEGQIQEAQWIFDLVLDAAIVYRALTGGLLPPQVHLILPNPFTCTFILIPFHCYHRTPNVEENKKKLTRWDIKKWFFTLTYLWICLSKICWFITNYFKISPHIPSPKCSQFGITFPVKMIILVVFLSYQYSWILGFGTFWIFEMHKEFEFNFKHWRLSHLHDNQDKVHRKDLNHLFVPCVHIHVHGQSGWKRYGLVLGSETYIKIHVFTYLWRLLFIDRGGCCLFKC